MKKLSRLSSALLLAMLVALPIKSAFAASVTVSIKQVNQDGAAQQVTCDLLAKNCVLPLTINAGTAAQQSLNVHVTYYSGGLALNFQTPNGYFYTDSTIGKIVLYGTLWNRPLQGSTPAAYTVTLFQPLSSKLPDATATGNHTPVANLIITATTNP